MMNRTVLYIVLIVLAVGLRVALGYFSVTNLPPSSDEAITFTLAESINRGENFPLLFTGQPYQFPVEAYLLSPFVGLLQHDAFSARIHLFVLSAVATLFLLLAAKEAFRPGHRWLAITLILMPSTYWLLHQAGQSVPQYSMSAVYTSIIFYFAILISKKRDLAVVLIILLGVISGLSLSNHLLLISVCLGAFLITIFREPNEKPFLRVGALFVGFLVGLAPLILAIIYVPGAYEEISNRVRLEVIIERLFDVVLVGATPGALGFNPPFYADYRKHLDWGNVLEYFSIVMFLSILAVASIARIKRVVKIILMKKWPYLAWPDMFLIVTVSSLLLMAANHRAASTDHRYLLPVIWSFPFLVGYTYSLAKPNKIIRRTICLFMIILLVVNLSTSFTVLKVWSKSDSIQKYADIHDIRETVDWLKTHDIRYCYATFWLAYRVTYESDGDIVCAPVYNERFNGWPIPYKKQVDQARNVAYVMSNTEGSKFPSIKLKKIFDSYQIGYNKFSIGVFNIYSDFSYPPALGEQSLSAKDYRIYTNANGAKTGLLSDGDISIPWTTFKKQKAGQYVELVFNDLQKVRRVDIVYPLVMPNVAKSVTVLGKVEDEWFPVVEDIEFVADKMRFDNNHPILGEYIQTVRFEPIELNSLRIETITANGRQYWGLSEIRVGVQQY